MENILAIIITLAILAAGAGLVYLLRRSGKTDAAAKLQAAIDSEAVQKLLAEALPWLCTQAEKLLGGGTGAVKKSYVIQEAMKLLPENLWARLDTTVMERAIDAALVKLRPLWGELPGLVAPEITVAEEELDAGPYLFKAGEDIAKGQTVELQALLLPVEDGEAEPAELTPEDAAPAEEAESE